MSAAAEAPILIIDNYDSFVFNLARYVRELGWPAEVVRNDALSVSELLEFRPSAVMVSPGPCSPREAGVSVELIRACRDRVPVLGICLGHQCLAVACGGRIERAPKPIHGRTSPIKHCGSGIWSGLPNPLRATRYHSLIVDRKSLPPELKITAETDDGLVMAIEHSSWSAYGWQFHPESVLTECGHELVRRFLNSIGLECSPAEFRELAVREPASAPELDSPLHW